MDDVPSGARPPVVPRVVLGVAGGIAAYKAVEAATGLSIKVRKFEVRALTVGEDAQGETVIYVEHGGRSYRGAAVSTNIVEASVNALLEVINRIELAQRNASRQPAV